MNWTAKPNPAETLIECVAPIPLALAVGWAGLQLGLSPVQAAAACMATMMTGFAAIRIIGGRAAESGPGFDLVEFPPADPMHDVLELSAADELLELDDPLIEPAPHARVVRLFAEPEPTPGELVARIEDFLGEGARCAARTELGAVAHPIPDAGAALQAALANVRASLR